jgi:hypothetical protein
LASNNELGEEFNYKPHYQSLMNYRYSKSMAFKNSNPFCIPGGQFADQACPQHLTYSREALGFFDQSLDGGGGAFALDEGNLNEQTGLTGVELPFYLMTYDCPDGMTDQALPDGPDIDWDCDGVFTGAGGSVDLSGSGIQILTGRNDWDNLNYEFQCAGNGDFLDAHSRELSEEPDSSFLAERGFLLPRWGVRSELWPGCSAHVLPEDNIGVVHAVLYGSDLLDTSRVEPWTIRFRKAYAKTLERRDVDLDGFTDLVVTFDTAEMWTVQPGTSVGLINARMDDSRIIVGHAPVSTVPFLVDSDGDNVHDECDQCPATPAGSAVDETGCP